jgi:hypothetical protein
VIMRAWRLLKPGRTVALIVFGTGYWYRPKPFIDQSSQIEQISNFPIETSKQPLPLIVRFSRQVVLFFGVTFSRAFLTLTGDFSILHDKFYHNFVQRVMHRENGRPLITVSNHRSLVDEPTLFSSLLPYYLNIQPKYIRYSICAQEYCFNDKVSTR